MVAKLKVVIGGVGHCSEVQMDYCGGEINDRLDRRIRIRTEE